MLELIVLGSVPGTHFQITYMQALVATLCAILFSVHMREVKNNTEEAQQ